MKLLIHSRVHSQPNQDEAMVDQVNDTKYHDLEMEWCLAENISMDTKRRGMGFLQTHPAGHIVTFSHRGCNLVLFYTF